MARPVESNSVTASSATRPGAAPATTAPSSPTPEQRREKLIGDYKARFANPYSAAERGYIDDVIIPHETRPKLIRALETLKTKRVETPKRKHGNIPL